MVVNFFKKVMLIKKLSSSVTHIKSISIQICHRDINTFGGKKKLLGFLSPIDVLKGKF